MIIIANECILMLESEWEQVKTSPQVIAREDMDIVAMSMTGSRVETFETDEEMNQRAANTPEF